MAIIDNCLKSNGVMSTFFFVLFFFLNFDFLQIVLIQRERQNPKNKKGMQLKRRKKRERKMKSRKGNPHLAPLLKAALPQVQTLKVKEAKHLVVVNTLQLWHLTSKNQYPDWFQKANEGRRNPFPSLSRNLNCLESKKKRHQISMCPQLRRRTVTLMNWRRSL